jgi:hypothetical protein
MFDMEFLIFAQAFKSKIKNFDKIRVFKRPKAKFNLI